MIHDFYQNVLAMVCEIVPPAFVLLDPAEQERCGAAWSCSLVTAGPVSAVQIAEYHNVLKKKRARRWSRRLALCRSHHHHAETADALDVHVTVLEQAAIQTKCETQLLSGQQAKVAIAAAFPLCRQV